MNNILTFKNPLKGEPNLTYDLTQIIAAQRRSSEIANVNQHRAPELLAVFSTAAFGLSDIIGDLHFQLFLAQRIVDQRKALLFIDVIPDILKDKKLGQNAETRQALVDLDVEYQDAMMVLGSIEAGMALIKEKLRGMEGALSAIKKCIDETVSVYRRGGNPDLGMAYDSKLDYDVSVPTEVDNSNPIGIGKAKYGAKNG